MLTFPGSTGTWLCSGGNQFAQSPLSSRVAVLCSFWVFSPAFLLDTSQQALWHCDSGSSLSGNSLTAFLVGREGGSHFQSVWSYDSAAWVWWDQALGLVKLLIWGLKLGRTVSCHIPWSECASKLVLQISEDAVEDYHFGNAGRKLVFRSNCLLLEASLCFSITIREPCKFRWKSHGVKPR